MIIKPIDKSKFAVLIVDMQPTYLKLIANQSRIDLLAAQEKLLKVCAKKDYPVLVLEYNYERETTRELLDYIKNVPRHKFIQKAFDDGFSENPGLEEILKELDIETLCITGINADCCVLQTIIGATKKGFKVVTSRKLIETRYGSSGIKSAEEWFSKYNIDYPMYSTLLCRLI